MKKPSQTMQWALALISILCFCSCGTKLDKASYFNYFNTFQEGSYVEVSENGYTYQLQYRPADFQALNEVKGENYTRETYEKARKDFEGQNLFCMRIIGNGKQDVLRQNIPNDAIYYQRLEKLNNEIPFMIKGIIGEDTLSTVFHHFERTFQLRPFIQVLFALDPRTDVHKLNKIRYTDGVFQNYLDLEFNNLKKYTQQLPKLKH